MGEINPRPDSINQPTHAAEAEASPPNDSMQNERGIMCGMGRSGAHIMMAVFAFAVIVAAGLSFGWGGWLIASLGGISLLFLLPCLAMCIGMLWMMMQGNKN